MLKKNLFIFISILILMLTVVSTFSGCIIGGDDENNIGEKSSGVESTKGEESGGEDIDVSDSSSINDLESEVQSRQKNNISEGNIGENNATPEEITSGKEEQLSDGNNASVDVPEEERDMFYVPLPPSEKKQNPKIKAKGIYVTANSAGLEPRFQNFIDMIDSTELNAMVIDIKNDHGVMTYPSEIEIVKEIMEGYSEPVRDIRKLIERLEEKNIYPIARIVVFRDPYLPKFHPEWAIHRKDGSIWADDKGFTWMNPYEKKVWDYNIAIAKEAALIGFKEIQFDYVRFPENAENFDMQVSITNEEDIPKDEIIKKFLLYATEELKDYNVYVSADVYGVIATYITDKDGIGQNWEKITSVIDYIYPMIYPSHYGPGFFGLSVPDARPEETILNALDNAIKRNATVKNPADIRPWLQGFTATWIKGHIDYTYMQIREQIDTAAKMGIEEFFVWNAGNEYDARSFLTEEEALKRQKGIRIYRYEMGLDYTGNTAQETLEKYLGYINEKNVIQVYPYHWSNFEMNIEKFSEWASRWTFDFLEFNISSVAPGWNNSFKVDITLKKGNESIVLKNQKFEVFMENKIWKVKSPVSFTEALSASYEE